MVQVITLDEGRSRLKGAVSNSQTWSTVSGLARIDKSRYQNALEREGDNMGLVSWNNNYYAIGDIASQYSMKQYSTTAERYNREDIGILTAYTIANLLRRFSNRTEIDTDIVISHPPGDLQYTPQLKDAVLGDWNIVAGGEKFSIRIERAFTYDEPLAILMNALLTVEGTSYQRRPDGSILVIDLGGVTADIAATSANGKINLGTIDSEEIGINETLQSFQNDIRARHSKEFQKVYRIDPDLIMEAFKTGYFKGGKILDCRDEAERHRQTYLNSLMTWLTNRTGGLLNYQTIILGGGGSALLQRELIDAISQENDNVIMAVPDNEIAHIHTAGVRGMLKVYNLWRKIGLIKD